MVELRNQISRPLPQLKGITPFKVLTGNTPEISEFLKVTWYQPIWYYEPNVFPKQNKQLARWLGVAHRVGQVMCYWILPISGIPIAQTTIQTIPKLELESENVINMLAIYDKEISEKLAVHNEANDFRLHREDEDPEQIDNEEEPVDPDAIICSITPLRQYFFSALCRFLASALSFCLASSFTTLSSIVSFSSMALVSI
jgi:hypothetical protein